MKRYLIFCIIMMPFLLTGHPIDKSKAQRVAVNFYKALSKTKTVDSTEVALEKWEEGGTTLFYIFNFRSGGWIITSADDQIKPIIAYNKDGRFNLESINSAAKDYLEEYASTIKDRLNSDYKSIESEKAWINGESKNTLSPLAVVWPLITQNWEEGCYYNGACPTNTVAESCYHAWAGTLSVPMAVLMKYFNWPESGFGYRKYKTRLYGEQEADFTTGNYNYANMPDFLTADNSDVAKLIYHCGVSVDMPYSKYLTDATYHEMPFALKNHFGFNEYLRLETFLLNVVEKLKSQLNESLPLIALTYSDLHDHAFLIDGYDENDLFHMNWCFGGDGNGYYSIFENPVINGHTYRYYYIITGLKPSAPDYIFSRQNAGFPARSMLSHGFSAVNNDICWAIGLVYNDDYSTFTINTTDGGKNWTSKKAISEYGYSISSLSAVSANVAYITKNKPNSTQDYQCGVFKTTDGGTTWSQFGILRGPQSFATDVHFWNENEGVAIGQPYDGYFEIYKTTNGGVTWTRIPSSDIGNGTGCLNYEGIFIGATNMTKDGIVAFGTNLGRIFISNDKGSTWSVKTIPGTNIKSIAIKSMSKYAIRSEYQTIMITKDGGNNFTTNYLEDQNDYFLSGKIISIPNTDTYVITEGDINSNPGDSGPRMYFTTDHGKTLNTLTRNREYYTFGGAFASDSVGWFGLKTSPLTVLPESDGLLKWSGRLNRTSDLVQTDPNPIVVDLPLHSTVLKKVRVQNTSNFTLTITPSIASGIHWVRIYDYTFYLDHINEGEYFDMDLLFDSYTLGIGTYYTDLIVMTNHGGLFKFPIYFNVGNVGINDEKSEAFSVYPNPTNDHFSIKSKIPFTKLRLLNLSGIPLKEYSNDSSDNYSLPDISAGIYLLELTNSSGVFYNRIVVTK